MKSIDDLGENARQILKKGNMYRIRYPRIKKETENYRTSTLSKEDIQRMINDCQEYNEKSQQDSRIIYYANREVIGDLELQIIKEMPL